MKKLSFSERVLGLTAKIPRGRVTTYKIIAQKVGVPRSARAVGQALGKNPHLLKIPCHRVVRSDGKVGGYRLGTSKKVKLLEREGVKIRCGRVVNFYKYFHNF